MLTALSPVIIDTPNKRLSVIGMGFIPAVDVKSWTGITVAVMEAFDRVTPYLMLVFPSICNLSLSHHECNFGCNRNII